MIAYCLDHTNAERDVHQKAATGQRHQHRLEFRSRWLDQGDAQQPAGQRGQSLVRAVFLLVFDGEDIKNIAAQNAFLGQHLGQRRTDVGYRTIVVKLQKHRHQPAHFRRLERNWRGHQTAP